VAAAAGVAVFAENRFRRKIDVYDSAPCRSVSKSPV